MIKKVSIVFVLIVVVAFFIFRSTVGPQLPIGAGYAAKKMCSCTFVADRSQSSIQNEDLSMPPLNLTKTKIDYDNKSVTSSIFGMGSRTAVYRENIGCILLDGDDDYGVSLELPEPEVDLTRFWPYGPRDIRDPVYGVDYKKLDVAIKSIFDPSMAIDSLKSRAVVVVYKDTLIGEMYANGYDKDTPLLGWSMTKSIVNAMVGILIKNKKMSLEDSNLFPHWSDERSAITIDDLLQMQSGLKFDEIYSEVSDATKMLFMSEDIVDVASNQPLIYEPGTHWSYSSGTSNILSGLIRNKFDDHNDYLRFPHDSLFRKLGMLSAHLETDESGNYIGSSYCYATPRDWAKFGLLYLNNGQWDGKEILPNEWIEYTQQSAKNSEGIYGAHFWHNKNHSSYPDVPSELYSCNGFEGQFVFIIPSYDLVVVRMGLSEKININKFLKDILSALKPIEN